MKSFSTFRFWFELVTATVTGALFFVTLAQRDWIETVFGVDPDQHNGSLEWLVIVALLVATVVLLSAARIEWQKIRTAPSL
jgi:hypothetical protein